MIMNEEHVEFDSPLGIVQRSIRLLEEEKEARERFEHEKWFEESYAEAKKGLPPYKGGEYNGAIKWTAILVVLSFLASYLMILITLFVYGVTIFIAYNAFTMAHARNKENLAKRAKKQAFYDDILSHEAPWAPYTEELEEKWHNSLKRLEEHLTVNKKYLSLDICHKIEGYILAERVDTLKEAYNLYEQDVKHDERIRLEQERLEHQKEIAYQQQVWQEKQEKIAKKQAEAIEDLSDEVDYMRGEVERTRTYY